MFFLTTCRQREEKQKRKLNQDLEKKKDERKTLTGGDTDGGRDI